MKKLRFKLTTLLLIIVVISFSFLGLFLSDIIKDAYISSLSDRLESETSLLADLVLVNGNVGNQNDQEELNKLATRYSSKVESRITIIDNGGIVIADSEFDRNKMDNHSNRPEIKEAYQGNKGEEIRYSDTLGMDMLYIASPIYQDDQIVGVIRLSVSLTQINESIKEIWHNIFVGLAIIFFITLFASYFMSNRITKPLENITRIARKITRNDFSERLKIYSDDEVGQLGKAINIMADGLEKHMAAIHESEEKLKTVIDNMSSGVILVDKHGKILLANPAIEWLIGEPASSITGKFHGDVGGQNSISELIHQSLTTGQAIHTEIGIYQHTKKYLNSNIVPILDYNGEVNGVLAVLHDITKLKRLENMRTEFVASVSHELRTPITAVKGFTETLLDGAMHDEETLKSFLQIIYNESDRLHRLISDLLDLSKIELNQDILNYSRVNLKELVQSVIEAVKPQVEKQRIHVKDEIEPLVVELDEDRMKQVFINLLSNSITYTPKGGKITLRAKSINQETIVLEVEDTGIGIPKKSLPRIFERFYRVDKARSRESGGTGLGLAIAKHIIESHGGTIQVESSVGVGTKFMIKLPIKKTET